MSSPAQIRSAADPSDAPDRNAESPVVFDPARFGRLATAAMTNHHRDHDAEDLAALRLVLELLHPAGRDFGIDVGDLVTTCLAHGVLRLNNPVTALAIEPTLIGGTRDGGFLVLLTLADTVTVVSRRTHTGDFFHQRAAAARLVLETIATVAADLYDAFRAAVAALSGPAAGSAEGSAPAGDQR